jgi:hypothetical protein
MIVIILFFYYLDDNKKMSFNRDYNKGLSYQIELLPTLESFFKDDIKETVGKYAKYDYEGNRAVYELKSRTNTYRCYPTTCIAMDKVDPDHKKKQVYLFHFTDGTYYIEYDEELFKTFEVKDFRRFREGVNDIQKPYLYIPIEKLTRIQ